MMPSRERLELVIARRDTVETAAGMAGGSCDGYDTTACRCGSGLSYGEPGCYRCDVVVDLLGAAERRRDHRWIAVLPALEWLAVLCGAALIGLAVARWIGGAS